MSYPLQASVVQFGEPLGVIFDVLNRAGHESVATVAAANDCSPAHVYDLLDAARRALQPRRPGPVPGTRAQEALHAEVAALRVRCAAAEARVAALEQRLVGAVVLDPRRLARLELVMAGHNVTFRGMHEILTVAFGAGAAPALGTLHGHVVGHGDRARGLLDRARAQVCTTLACVMGDDVFLAGAGVKVVAEPRSNAVLDVGRCPGRKAADWTRWTREFTGLRLFISDLGTDLVGAIDARPDVAHIIDYWHEMDWWADEVFGPLTRDHARVGEAIADAQAALAKVSGDARRQARLGIARDARHQRRIEREFYWACEAQDRVRALYQPLDLAGLPWTDATVTATLARIATTLRQIIHAAGWTARTHVERNAHRYATHRVLMDTLTIDLRPGSPWTHGEVLGALAREQALHRRANDMTLPVADQMCADRQARHLAAAVAKHCVNAVAVRAEWMDLVRFPRRSSSGTESFNNRLRVLQVVQRFVSDDRMALHAVAHNLTLRREGPRRGQSPYQILGIDFATPGTPWYDVLLDAA